MSQNEVANDTPLFARTIAILIASVTLQGCAMNKPNLFCSEGCGSRSEPVTKQWSPELHDYLYPHGSEKYIVVHPATDVWELDQRCGKPGLIRGLFSIVALEAVRGAQLAAKLVTAKIAAKLVTAKIVTDDSMPKICKAALQKAADHNTNPEVLAEVQQWQHTHQ